MSFNSFNKQSKDTKDIKDAKNAVKSEEPYNSAKRSSNSSANTIADLLDADTALFSENTSNTSLNPSLMDEDVNDEDVNFSDEKPAMAGADVSDHLPEAHLQTYQEQQAKIASLEEELRKSHELFVRARAEADNIQRRADKSIADAHKYGLEKLVKRLLEVIDSLERALEIELDAQDSDAAKSLHQGVELTSELLQASLTQFAVEAIDPQNVVFDSKYHEAIAMQPTEGVKSGTILAVIQKGYTLHGRLVRPARVIVAS